VKDRSPAIQFYFRQFSSDEQVKAMDLDTVGAHILLICAAGMSAHGHKLPSNERFLRAQIQYPSDEAWQRIKSQLLDGAWKVSADGKWWVQDGLKRSVLKRQEFFSEQKRKAKLGADARWHPRGHNSGMPGPMPQDAPSSASASASASASSTSLPKSKATTKPRAVTPPAPADARHPECREYAYKAFERKHGQPPAWNGRHYAALKEVLSIRRSLTSLEFFRRFENFLASTEPFTAKQGDSLAYFCQHFDSFLEGPIISAPARKGGKLSGRELTEANLRATGFIS